MQKSDITILVGVLERLEKQSITTSEMFKAISNNQAIQNKLILEFIEDARAYREERAQRENLNTDQKIDQAIKRNSIGQWLIDKVLPAVIIALTLWIMKAY